MSGRLTVSLMHMTHLNCYIKVWFAGMENKTVIMPYHEQKWYLVQCDYYLCLTRGGNYITASLDNWDEGRILADPPEKCERFEWTYDPLS